MIITDRFIFVHVPKTGGMAITQALGGKSVGVSTHTPLRCIDKGDRFAFGFIRNPWARMVSLYRFLCQKTFRKTDNFDQPAVREMGFRRWLMNNEFVMQEDDHPAGEPWVMRDKWRDGGQVPIAVRAAPDGRVIAAMQRRPQLWWLRGADFIGRTENLVEDFGCAMQKVGMHPPRLGHVNRTNGGDWRAEYDAESRAFVAKHFAEDIEFGGYRFCAS